MAHHPTALIKTSGIPRCPISHERLHDPVILDCVCKGTLSRRSFLTWYQHQDVASTETNGRVLPNCPICGSGLRSVHVVPNVPLREMLEAIVSPVVVEEPTSPIITTAVRARTRKQVGQDLVGDVMSISLSSHGNRVAIGRKLPGTLTVHVRIYDWTESQWVQLGPDFVVSRYSCDQGVVLSSDGNRVAFGTPSPEINDCVHVRIYDWAGGHWTQVGSDLVGEIAEDSVSDIAMSSDGNRVAFGASAPNKRGGASRVQVFDWVCRQWTQVGSNLYVERQATCLTLSSDGNRVALGCPFSTKTSSTPSAGFVRIYELTDEQWTQVGANLVGETVGDWFGARVALSSDGNRVAIGAPRNNGRRAGNVRIFDWTGNQWTKVGPDLVGMTTHRCFGWSVTLSSDGSRVAIGTPNFDELSQQAGHVGIYDWTGSQWRKTGSELVGQAGNLFGEYIAMSSCGNRLAIYEEVLSGHATSYVRLYDLEESCL